MRIRKKKIKFQYLTIYFDDYLWILIINNYCKIFLFVDKMSINIVPIQFLVDKALSMNFNCLNLFFLVILEDVGRRLQK